MQAFVTLPKDVEEGDLVKLEQNIYWSRENKKFYKSSILPSLTLLDNDNLIKR